MARTLVFVDDNEAIVGIMEMELSGHYNTKTFTDPYNALEYIQNNKGAIDILLTDYMMPQMNGLQLIELVKGIDQSIRTIILTGYRQNVGEIPKSLCNLILDKNVLVDNNNLIEILNNN
ncbi:MAG: hypothetical protein A2Y40_03695 [Candidatus Margulisbacteria bacterium GWF2_35_9]|nr:MAG: hypothetical protein A2Y40_03695 [Candidatus Margulisbacteria bacterium GWF2_35_9]